MKPYKSTWKRVILLGYPMGPNWAPVFLVIGNDLIQALFYGSSGGGGGSKFNHTRKKFTTMNNQLNKQQEHRLKQQH